MCRISLSLLSTSYRYIFIYDFYVLLGATCVSFNYYQEINIIARTHTSSTQRVTFITRANFTITQSNRRKSNNTTINIIWSLPIWGGGGEWELTISESTIFRSWLLLFYCGQIFLVRRRMMMYATWYPLLIFCFSQNSDNQSIWLTPSHDHWHLRQCDLHYRHG